MAQVIAKKFEVGRSAAGASAITTWIATAITGGNAILLASVEYSQNDLNYVLVVMSTAMTASSGQLAISASHLVAAEFEIKEHDFAPLVAYLNTQYAAGAVKLQSINLVPRGNSVEALVVLSA